MTEEINVKYLANNNLKETEELYKNFREKYKIRLNGNTLIIKERNNNSGINISPEEGEIYGIIALKPTSELELTLKENDFSKDGFLVFETRNDKKILVNYTNKYL